MRFKEGAGVLGVRAIGHAGERHGGNLGSVSSPGKKVGDDGWGLVGSQSDGARGLRESGADKRGPGCQRRGRGRVTRGRPTLGERGCWAGSGCFAGPSWEVERAHRAC